MTSTLPSAVSSEAPPDRAQEIHQLIETLGLPNGRLSPDELEELALAVSGHPELWEDLVVDSTDRRWWLVLHQTPGYEVRLLSWELDQSSGWHDHGGSSGGFVVTSGTLRERCRAEDAVSVDENLFQHGQHGNFGPAHVHDVLHDEGRPAVSIHAYSPPLTQLTMYDVTPYGFVAREVVPDDSRGL